MTAKFTLKDYNRQKEINTEQSHLQIERNIF